VWPSEQCGLVEVWVVVALPKPSFGAAEVVARSDSNSCCLVLNYCCRLRASQFELDGRWALDWEQSLSERRLLFGPWVILIPERAGC
jgi:hypothetical protein